MAVAISKLRMSCNAGDFTILHFMEGVTADDHPISTGRHALICPAAVCMEAVFLPRRLCYGQIALKHVVGSECSLALAQGIVAALDHAELSMESIESIKVYHNVSKCTESEAMALLQQVQVELKASWAPAIVPVLSVGMTPATDAALHLMMLASKDAT
jgi:hypothetical protein